MGKILVIGSLNMDYVIRVSEMVEPGQTIFGNSLKLIPGGKGANQAFAAGKLGTKVSMIGAVGADDDGKILIENLKTAGVDTKGICIIEDKNTGAAFITVNDKGENSIVVIPGANMSVSKELIDKNIGLMDECDMVLMQLEVPMDTIIYAAKLAKKMGKKVILDPAPAPKSLSNDLLHNLDIIKPNETELETIVNKKLSSKNIAEEAVNASKKLISRGVGRVIVTLGRHGAVMVTEDDFLYSTPTYNPKRVDTTGAGDCFMAAFAGHLLKNNSYEKAIEFANIASSIAITRNGAQSSFPTEEEVLNKVNEYSL